ncbi:MAG: fatty acid CoA ligase family protein [bacterium]
MSKKETFNIASYLPVMAEKRPDKRAVVYPQGRDKQGRVAYTHLTFSQLNAQSSRYARALADLGVGRGCRTLLMVKPSLEFVALAFALFRLGAVPVLIDPGMGPSKLLKCIRQVEPEALVAIPLVHLVKLFRQRFFISLRYNVTVGKNLFWDGPSLAEIADNDCEDFPPADTSRTDPAAILFTSGSTGIPKGVLYEHGMFDAQVKKIRKHYGIRESDVDMPAFPLFALFSAAMGMTCVIPDMDPTKPARVDPRKIVEAIHNQGVTNSFGSPAIWNRVGKYCHIHNVKLPSLKRVLMAGAPVYPPLMEVLTAVLPEEAMIHSPYGATESLPITSISSREILTDTRSETDAGAGTCVGKPLPGAVIKIIKITDDPISEWRDDLLVRPGEKGEIAVKGDVVTKEYFRMKEKTDLAKIKEGKKIWHRIGDIGYFDAQGRLWFCGRKSHRVITREGTMFTVPCEAVFNRHHAVFRSALVGVGPAGDKQPVIIIEPEAGMMPQSSEAKKQFIRELLERGVEFEHTRMINTVLFHYDFPVDVRHNVKINREALAGWAEAELR